MRACAGRYLPALVDHRSLERKGMDREAGTDDPGGVLAAAKPEGARCGRLRSAHGI